jgi:tRNA (guanine37-N1)-methyltransferase
MKIQIITLFPEMFLGVFEHSMLFKAQHQQLVAIEIINLREFGLGPRRTVDDTPYGGGDGMILKPEPLAAAIENARHSDAKARVILLTPGGERLEQARVRALAEADGLILVCGRYEGYDERIATLADEEISIGDYVLTGGEIPAMVVVDSVARLIPGVLGGANSAVDESFSVGNQLEYPQYTRPETWRGMKVPEVLLSGDHGRIAEWRQAESLKKTRQRQARSDKH